MQLAAFDDALVDAFETAADDEAARACRQFAHEALGEGFAARAHQQARAHMGGGIDGRRQNIGFQHHAGAAAGRMVIHGAVPVGGGGADVADVEGPEAVVQRLARQRNAERAGKHFGKEGEDGGGEGHSCSSPSSR